ncbi:hypothetical protein [Alkalicoccobacillus porphyridii]|uniref:Uncharacterized protein n=1 Tax=Alkalicoccobacillus porphyridii TaxID=2597270 RepID=A0A554A488_9BACI|nr:hypothetical protein [Alkalicoccobacillus porphyridii]TSB48510.1 hypothetical protein FN960_02860 [Alkalicoccobacillus porphyridii]
MTLTSGPAKIEVSDEQLEQLQSVYQALQEDINSMLTDFFTPFELMVGEEIFVGESAEAFASYCTLVRSYLEARADVSLTELQHAGQTFSNKINEVESI